MIAGFRHKGLRSLFEQDDGRRVKADRVDRLRLILSALDQAGDIQGYETADVSAAPAQREPQRVWAVTVRANWRVTFRFESGDAHDVDSEDYH